MCLASHACNDSSWPLFPPRQGACSNPHPHPKPTYPPPHPSRLVSAASEHFQRELKASGTWLCKRNISGSSHTLGHLR